MPRRRLLAERTPWGPMIEFALVEQTPSGSYYAAALPATMSQVAEGDRVAPFCMIDISAAQGLMDDLWRAGLRPSEGTGSAGALAATERHLADLRTALQKKGVL